MLIALDYDGTYTRDPEFWLAFIQWTLGCGHQMVCTTMRTEAELALMDERIGNMIPVLCTSRKAKKPEVESRGVFPDIWIDDEPSWLYQDAGDVQEHMGSVTRRHYPWAGG